MKTFRLWMLAATLICGASVFTSCSSDNDDNPATNPDEPQQQLADFSMHTHGYTGSNFKIEATNPMLSLSVSKDLFKRRLNIKLTGNDLFNQGKSRGTYYFDRMILRKTEDNDTRCVSLSLRYRFNVTPSKYKGTGAIR